MGKIIFNVPSGKADISKLDVSGALLKSATPITVTLLDGGDVGAIEAGGNFSLISENLTVKGPANFSEGATFGSTAGFKGIVTFNGPVTFGALVTFDAGADFKDAVVFGGSSTFKGNAAFRSAVTLNGFSEFKKEVTFSDVTTLGKDGKINIAGGGKLDVRNAKFNLWGTVSVRGSAAIALPESEAIWGDNAPNMPTNILSLLFVSKDEVVTGDGAVFYNQGSGSIQLNEGAKGQYGNTTFIDKADGVSNYFTWGTTSTASLH